MTRDMAGRLMGTTQESFIKLGFHLVLFFFYLYRYVSRLGYNEPETAY